MWVVAFIEVVMDNVKSFEAGRSFWPGPFIFSGSAEVMSENQKTVVLIEDDRDISATIQSVLSGAGYRVFSANNGQHGRRLIQTQKPDLVLTDMMMPRMGGFPVLEFLAEMADAPPVIMMTANEGSRHKAYAEMLGVVDYLRKPFAMEVMLESVARAITGNSAGDT